MTLTFGSLFAGIGGIDLGFERAGMRCLWQCEFDPFCQAVLRKHWPDIPCYPDVRTLKGSEVEPVDILAGGFPCQPFSLAGRRKAQEDPRHLWPEFARLIGELRPAYVVGENVRGLTSKGLEEVLADLTCMGYDAEWQVVSAAALGAPHLRERVFIVAYASGPELWDEPGRSSGAHGQGTAVAGNDGTAQSLADADSEGQPDAQGCEGSPEQARWQVFGPESYRPGSYHWSPEPDVGRVAHGVPGRVDRLRALGNAVVPQVAEFIARLIIEREKRSGVRAVV